jgi:hypothetical protein
VNLFSFDAETDGLYGEVWAIGAVVLDDNNNEVARFEGMIDSICVKDQWVIDNIVPLVQLRMFGARHEMLEGFWSFWMRHKANALCIADYGAPVEAGLMRACVEQDREKRNWDGPYPMHELGTALLLAGLDPDLDRRLFVGRPDLVKHHPVHDAIAAALCWRKAEGCCS